LLADELSEQDLYAPVEVKAVTSSGPDAGTLTLETIRNGKPTERTVKVAGTEVFRGDAKARPESLKAGEQIHLQTTGESARLVVDPAAFEQRRAAQKAALHGRWAAEGLPGTLVFSHAQRREVEIMLDHEAMRWGRSCGDHSCCHSKTPVVSLMPSDVRPHRNTAYGEKQTQRRSVEGRRDPKLPVIAPHG
jgi:hypothetical protein